MMNGPDRDQTPFSGRVWQEIDRTIQSVKAANCTARRFLEIDGPYGLGLTSVASGDAFQNPGGLPREYESWGVRFAHAQGDPAEPEGLHGTYLAAGHSRPVPLMASEFTIDQRTLAGYEAGCQPIELAHATRAARGVALEEERLIYYGNPHTPHRHYHHCRALDHECLLQRVAIRGDDPSNVTPVYYPRTEAEEESDFEQEDLIEDLHRAIRALAERGFAGPFALVAEPTLYSSVYLPNDFDDAIGTDLIKPLFRGGIHMAPVIKPFYADEHCPQDLRAGAIVTLGRGNSRLVVGQDWSVGYRGLNGIFYRFLIESSLQLQISEPLSIQVLTWRNPKPKASVDRYLDAATGQPVTSAVSGTSIVISGSGLGDSGSVTFNGPDSVCAGKVTHWSTTGIWVVVPPFGSQPIDADVMVKPTGATEVRAPKPLGIEPLPPP